MTDEDNTEVAKEPMYGACTSSKKCQKILKCDEPTTVCKQVKKCESETVKICTEIIKDENITVINDPKLNETEIKPDQEETKINQEPKVTEEPSTTTTTTTTTSSTTTTSTTTTTKEPKLVEEPKIDEPVTKEEPKDEVNLNEVKEPTITRKRRMTDLLKLDSELIINEEEEQVPENLQIVNLAKITKKSKSDEENLDQGTNEKRCEFKTVPRCKRENVCEEVKPECRMVVTCGKNNCRPCMKPNCRRQRPIEPNKKRQRKFFQPYNYRLFYYPVVDYANSGYYGVF